MKCNILGVEIDDLSAGEAMDLAAARLAAGKKTFIATPNPEMVILAQKDGEFKNILNGADIKIPDGTGLAVGAKILKQALKNRVTGTDLMEGLCALSAELGYKVYLLGAQNGVAKEAAKRLNTKFVQLKIVGAEYGGRMDEWDNRVIIEHINAVAPDILFVALGHGKQERWIFQNLEKLPSVKLAMGVGGAFDFFAGRIRRAPRWMRTLGLEWLWRLICEPKRYKRIFNAVIIFPWRCLLYRYGRKK
jgi:N-acetylglucosaminyldiphosphoundecaprenol N-acetyl-beta-D-mannosaminyltransferase